MLKGPSFARWLYADDEPRIYFDSDILVSPDRAADAEAVLERLGFVRETVGEIARDIPRHSRSWIRTRDGGAVDLHTTLPFVTVTPANAWDTLGRATETVSLAGTDIEILREPARALHVALHAAHHGSKADQPIEDLRRAVEQVTAPVWEEAAAIAGRLGADTALGAGLRLDPKGSEIAAELRLPERPPADVALHDAPPTALAFEWMAQMPRFSQRIAFVLRKVFPPPDLIRASFAPATRSRWGLAAGYAWRPISLLIHAPSGFRAWRAARKGARDSVSK